MKFQHGVIVFVLFLVCAFPVLSQKNEEIAREFLQDKFHFSEDELSAVDRGEIVTKLFDSDSVSEVAIGAATHLSVPYAFATKTYQQIERLIPNTASVEMGRFHRPPRLDDLSKLTVDPNDLNALQHCVPGNCEEKLSSELMKRFRTEINWKSQDHRPKVLSLVKQVLVDYVSSYLAWGNAALIEYDDQDQPRQTADMLDGILQEQPNLFNFGPDLFCYLKEFSKDSLSNATDYIYWQKEIHSGIKPTLTLNHVTIYAPDTNKSITLIASKQIYANHYFEASLRLTAMIGTTEEDSSCYLISLNRSCFDDLRKTGFLSFRSRVRDEIYSRMQGELRFNVERLKQLFIQSKEIKHLPN